MLAPLAECRDEEVRRAVGHEVLFGEAGRGGDEDGDLDDARDLLEVAERGFCLRQDVDRAELRAPPTWSLPSASGSWPAVNSRFPVRMKGT